MEGAKNEIGIKIKRAMQEMDLTQELLGKKIWSNQKIVSRWITGGRNPSLKNLQKIAEATGKSLNFFWKVKLIQKQK